jgi:hypothetical protein
MGREKALWLDAAVVVRKRKLSVLWDYIARSDVMLFRNGGCMESMFTSEDCLEKLGCNMKRAENLTQCCGGIIGLNFRSYKGNRVLDQMLGYAKDGVSFQGKSGSKHPQFQAHRHDQSCLTVVGDDLGIPFLRQEWLAYSYASNAQDAILVLEGMG